MDTEKYTLLSDSQAEALCKDGKGAYAKSSSTKSVAAIFAGRICTLFNLVNAIIAVLLAFVGSFKNMAFLGVVIFNTVIGIFQELKAKRITDKLVNAACPEVTVRRSDGEKKLRWDRVAKGDTVILSEGTAVCADCTVLEGFAECDDSALTGESEPLSVSVGDVIPSGCAVITGKAVCVVSAAGNETKAFVIGESARRVKLKNSVIIGNLNKILRIISLSLIPFGCVFFCKLFFIDGVEFADAVTSVAASTVGMIPSGLILLTSTALAVGVIRLSTKKVLVNEMNGIEMLARTDTVCLDKTGTITTGNLTVADCIFISERDAALRALATVCRYSANATASAVKVYASSACAKSFEILSSVPFSSARKWSGVSTDGGVFLFGAPEMLLTDEQRSKYNLETLCKSYRTVCLCSCDELPEKDRLPKCVRLLCIVLLREELREGAAQAVSELQAAGVTVKVISGDNPVTVAASASFCGVANAEKIFDLSSIHAVVDYSALAEEYTVFGRATPEQKKLLIQGLRANKHVVSMTGDGINDLPAMKEADCSIALAGGTDGSRAVGDIVMSGNGFSDLAHIIGEGRTVINNIGRYSSLFLTKTVFSALLTLIFLFLPFEYSLLPIQLTLVGGFTIGAPAFLLSLMRDTSAPRGRFFDGIFTYSLPAGIITAAAAALLAAMNASGEISVLVLAAVNLAVLVCVCLPFNKYKAAVCAAMLCGLSACAIFLGGFFEIALSPSDFPVAAIACVASVLLFFIGRFLVEKLIATKNDGVTVVHDGENKEE